MSERCRCSRLADSDLNILKMTLPRMPPPVSPMLISRCVTVEVCASRAITHWKALDDSQVGANCASSTQLGGW